MVMTSDAGSGDEGIKSIVNGMFDPSSEGGLSKVAYLKMVEAVDFLMDNYKSVPVKVFRDYLFMVVKILDVKAGQAVSAGKEAIPRKLMSDMRSVFSPVRSRRNLI